jgi:hypothetical protein
MSATLFNGTRPFKSMDGRIAGLSLSLSEILRAFSSDAAFPNPQNTLFRWTDLQQQLNSGYFLDGYTAEEIALALGRTT